MSSSTGTSVGGAGRTKRSCAFTACRGPRALAHAAAYADFETALGFLMDWPAHREAAALVERRIGQVRTHLPMKADWAARLAQKYPDAAERLLAAP